MYVLFLDEGIACPNEEKCAWCLPEAGSVFWIRWHPQRERGTISLLTAAEHGELQKEEALWVQGGEGRGGDTVTWWRETWNICICISHKIRIFKGLSVDQSPAVRGDQITCWKRPKAEAFWYSSPGLFCHRQCLLVWGPSFVSSPFARAHEAPAHNQSPLMHMAEL